MIPGGANGGVKPAVLTFLRVLEHEHGDTFRFILLTNSSTHNDLLSLVRPGDLMLCVLEAHGGEISKVQTPAHNVRIVRTFKPTLLKRLGVDVLYCPFGSTERSIPAIPTIAMVVDLLHRDYPFSLSDGERVWREEYFQQLLLDADYVQGISNHTVSRLLHHYPLSSEKVFFTYLPIDQRLQSAPARRVQNPFFIYPANFWVHKNHEILLIAYGLYRDTSAENRWDLVLTGHLDKRAEQLKSLANTLGIGRYVHFKGHLNEEEFADLFERAGALVYPSLHEGFGIPLVEAMRFRKPIICGRHTSLPEIAGSAAFYINAKDPVELASAMKQVSEDQELRAWLVHSGEHRLSEFSISKEVQKLAEILLIAKKNNNQLAVFRRYLVRCGREGRRRAAGFVKKMDHNAESSQTVSRKEHQALERCTVGIDLTSLLPGGINGGHKIAILSQLENLRRFYPGKFRFVFLTSSLSHQEIKLFEADGDQSLCILDLGDSEQRRTPRIGIPLPKLSRYRKLGIDVCYCPFGDIRRAPPGSPVVAWIADVLHRDYPFSISQDDRAFRETYYRLLANGADYIQVNSRFTAERLSELYGIDLNKMFVTHLPPRKLADQRQAPGTTSYFLYPANFWVHKNHECLLLAYYNYLQIAGREAWDLRMTGNPDPRMDYLQKLSRSLGMQGKAHFAGFLNTRDFTDLTSAASALVFPSLYEGFGMPVAEAMLLGIPVIASDAASIPEVGGEACHYVDGRKPLELARAMLRVSTDQAYRSYLSAAGREQVKQFSAMTSGSVLGERFLDAACAKRDWRYCVLRWKNMSYGLLLGLKNGLVYRLRMWKAALMRA